MSQQSLNHWATNDLIFASSSIAAWREIVNFSIASDQKQNFSFDLMVGGGRHFD